jgi:hypothetical protein
MSAQDPELLRRWISVIAATPSVWRGVLGGIQLKSQQVIAEFFGARLNLPSNALVPTMLAAAAGGVIQASQTHWYFEGGDLVTAFSEGLEVLEHGIGADPRTWANAKPTSSGLDRPISGTLRQASGTDVAPTRPRRPRG